MRLVSPPLLALCATVTLAALPSAPAHAARAVARVRVAPQGATLRPAQTLLFTAEALDRAGKPVPRARIAWSSNRGAVAQVARDGTVTAHSPGVAQITARSGSRKTTVLVAVVPVATEVLDQPAAGLSQVNHIAVDGENIYWTEVNKKILRLRKTPLEGGPITDLATQVSTDSRGLKYTFVHLRLVGDHVYFTRRFVGLEDHWAILRVPKAGGRVQRVLMDDVSIEPLIGTGWGVVGRFILASVAAPRRIGLAGNTRLAGYDTSSGVWFSVLTGPFGRRGLLVSGTTETDAFVRGVNENDSTEIFRVKPEEGDLTKIPLVQEDGINRAIIERAAVVGEHLYFWSRSGESYRLRRVPIAGGAPPSVVLNGNFGEGLTADDAAGLLYWVRGRSELVRLDTAAATAPVLLLPNVFGTASVGGIAQDATSLYVARKTGNRFSILRLRK
jgi:hypothetical protein